MRRSLLLLIFFVPLVSFAQTPQDKVREYRRANEQKIIREFVSLLALPNVASDMPNMTTVVQSPPSIPGKSAPGAYNRHGSGVHLLSLISLGVLALWGRGVKGKVFRRVRRACRRVRAPTSRYRMARQG